LTGLTVGNALKYTPSGRVTIKLFTDQGSDEEESTNVTLLVEDTGIGMSKDFVANDVFVPFRQADSHSPGTGLGLSIVKEVVKEFKGSLDVHSELEKGSRVSVRFAATLTKPSESADDDLGSSVVGAQGRHIRMFQLADHLGRSSPHSTRNVAGSLQRTASQWLGCEISTSQEMTPVPPGCTCAVSEAELSMLNREHPDGVRALIETLAESDSRLLIFARSIASSQPEFEFKNFKTKPIYVHQP